MLHKTRVRLFIVTVTLMSAVPAMADPARCGDAPFPPALPSLNDIASLPSRDAGIAKHQAFEDVVNWQKGLKTYRDCLNTLIDDDNFKITGDQNGGSKDDLDEIKGLRGDVSNINAIYNKTVDTEKTIVGNYDSISKAYCARQDTDPSLCQQTK